MGEIVVLDFGMGNLRSVAKALEQAGARATITEDPDAVRRADRLVMPGVGALGDCMRTLAERGVDDALRERLGSQRPFLGICLGLEVLFESSEEGDARGLGLLAGRIERFPSRPGLPVPHMGWNQVTPTRPHPVLRSDYFYFVHSFRAADAPPDTIAATTDYGGAFVSAVAFGAVLAVQFHPEKSQRAGLGLLQRFSAWAP
jgi:glutamine amidotransferase